MSDAEEFHQAAIRSVRTDAENIQSLIDWHRSEIRDHFARLMTYKRSPDCCGCASFPLAMCGVCAKLNNPEMFEPGYEPWRRT